ncbi:MAG: DUF484 family protein [Smithellaceae bacterium]|nr:DUF484 family protein [Smithellaceae bacterium]
MDETRETRKRNEEIARKFALIDSSFLSFTSISELCENLILLVEEEFAIPFVWLTLIDSPETAFLRGEIVVSPIVRDRLNIVSTEEFHDLAGDQTAPVLNNSDLQPFYKLLPEREKYLIRSIAVAPFRIEEIPAGSLNLGDHSPLRYQPDMDTTLLNHLMKRFSERLTHLLRISRS